ncbi:hypothetical protein BHE74_00002482 [Ensete ventricosum]|nr:hypothetical protein BHE74_00002482 [Ensete ventricosum]
MVDSQSLESLLAVQEGVAAGVMSDQTERVWCPVGDLHILAVPIVVGRLLGVSSITERSVGALMRSDLLVQREGWEDDYDKTIEMLLPRLMFVGELIISVDMIKG